MTLARDSRLENQKLAFGLMMQVLGDEAYDITAFNPSQPPFDGRILRTTWEEMERAGYVENFGPTQYRLTAKGWLVGLEVTDASQSAEYIERLGRLLAVMKGHVKGRKDSVVVPLRDLAAESSEAEGWIFNIIDSRSGSTGGRTGANWHEGARGRIVEIPVDFNLEPVDIVYALTVQHLEKIEQLEARLAEVAEDRAQFYCPYCDAPLSTVGHEDFPEHHCIVTYETFACGYSTADGFEKAPCPYGPRWPAPDEFDFVTKQSGEMYVCVLIGKTERARRVHVYSEMGRTKEEAEERAREAVAPKKK